MDLEEIVNIISLYFRDGGETVERRYGPEARDLIEDMNELLEEQLSAEAPFAALWRDYTAAPEENEAELIGALEVIQEANPTVAERLDAFFDAFEFSAETGEAPVGDDLDEYQRDTGREQRSLDQVPVTGIEAGVEERQGAVDRLAGDDQDDPAEAARDSEIPMDPDQRERFYEEEVTEKSLRHPYYPDYVDESNLYLAGDVQDDQSTSPSMYFDDEGSDNADYSAKPEEDLDDYDEEDEADHEDPDQIA
ncbi:MAG TPA: hypothetical protein VFF68_00275 [Anaerolineaceae bacterium]|nr:hypothetical protein [Anaerolineaceae bacterium]